MKLDANRNKIPTDSIGYVLIEYPRAIFFYCDSAGRVGVRKQGWIHWWHRSPRSGEFELCGFTKTPGKDAQKLTAPGGPNRRRA